MPSNGWILTALVDRATKCLATALGSAHSCDKSHCLADVAFVMVSCVVNVYTGRSKGGMVGYERRSRDGGTG